MCKAIVPFCFTRLLYFRIMKIYLWMNECRSSLIIVESTSMTIFTTIMTKPIVWMKVYYSLWYFISSHYTRYAIRRLWQKANRIPWDAPCFSNLKKLFVFISHTKQNSKNNLYQVKYINQVRVRLKLIMYFTLKKEATIRFRAIDIDIENIETKTNYFWT